MRGGGECEVDPVTRTNCKSCRLARCRKAGMDDARVDRVERKLGRLKQAKTKPATEYVLVARETPKEVEVENVERSVERLSGSSSVDMESLVEECFEEQALDRCNEDNEVSAAVSCSNLLQNTDPVFELTFEEEFKIHELVVRKESLFDTMFPLLLQVPQISWLFNHFLCGPHPRSPWPGIGPAFQWLLKEGKAKVREIIVSNLEEGGQIRACLDMFDEYKHVEETAKKETFQFSLRVLHICTRYKTISRHSSKTWLSPGRFCESTVTKRHGENKPEQLEFSHKESLTPSLLNILQKGSPILMFKV